MTRSGEPTMRCFEPADFANLREGHIPPEESASIESHLRSCPRCRENARVLSPLLDALPGVFAGSGEGPADACPDPFEWLDLLEDRLDAARADTLRAHAAQCGRCAASLAEVLVGRDQSLPRIDPLAAAAVERARGLAERAPARPRRERRTRHWVWAAGLAAAAVLAGIMIMLPTLNGPPGTTRAPIRSERGIAAPLAAPLVLAPTEGQRLPRAGLTFRWQAMAGARRYEVTLLDDHGLTLWRGNAKDGALAAPPSLPLETGRHYFVAVTAELEDGTLRRAPAVGFFLAPPATP